MPETKDGQPSFQEILQFDPFEGQDTSAEPETPAEEQPAADVEEPAGGDAGATPKPEVATPPATKTTPAAPPPPAQPAMSAADMANLIRQQATATAEAVRSAVQPQVQAPQARQEQRFNLGVPDELVTALRSEDPNVFKTGVGALINGISNHVWQAFQESVARDFAPAVTRLIEQHVNTSRQQDNVANDFYGAYPMFNNPLLTQMVQAAGQMVGQEWIQAGKPLAWTPELRDAIAERVFSAVPAMRPAAQAAAAPRRTNGARPFATGGGTRPEATPQPQQDMMDVIFGPGSRN